MSNPNEKDIRAMEGRQAAIDRLEYYLNRTSDPARQQSLINEIIGLQSEQQRQIAAQFFRQNFDPNIHDL